MKKNIFIPDTMPLIPLKDTVVFPQSITSLYINQARSKKAIASAMKTNRMVFLSAIESPDKGRQTVYKTGCVSLIRQRKDTPDGRVKILVQGLERATIKTLVEEEFSAVSLNVQKEPVFDEKECKKSLDELKVQLKDLFHSKKFLTFDFLLILNGVKNPGEVCDLVLSHLNLKPPALQKALETFDIKARIELTKKFLWEEFEMFQLQGQIKNILKKQPPNSVPSFRVDSFKTNKKEDVNEYGVRIQEANLPDAVLKEAKRQLGRLEKMHTESSDASIIRNYLDWILELPWQKSSQDRLDLKEAQIILDKNHFELDKAKERILEFLAVQSLTKTPSGPILCFAGPPGVGKTSLAQSIATAIGRKCFRVSLGGLKDEAEIRGHRKTYVGAMPGKIIQALKNCGTNNPVIILDEVDKLCSDFRGDPSSALLEVLDPEQNHSFKDHFLNLNFDLSHVLFIATANLVQNVLPALRDRFEIISISGYTREEKVKIAKNYLSKKVLSGSGLPEKHIDFTEEGLKAIVEFYTREAGLRNLKREMASICRKAAKNFVMGRKEPLVVTKEKVMELLGVPRFLPEERLKEPKVGVATGLAWTEAGGQLLHVETLKLKSRKGGGTLILKTGDNLTGKVQETMFESAQLALKYVRSCCERLHIHLEWFAQNEIHIHVPEGATPKDGPSAGVTLATALLSLVTKIPVNNNLAMTGEIELHGNVRAVGGIKDKVLAAFDRGVKTVLIPKENKKDLALIPENIRSQMKIILVKHLDEVFEHALVFSDNMNNLISEEEGSSDSPAEAA